MRTLLFVAIAVVLSALVNEVRAVDMTGAPVKFQTVLDPKASGCENPRLDERSGVYQIDDGRFGVLVIFSCGGDHEETEQPEVSQQGVQGTP